MKFGNLVKLIVQYCWKKIQPCKGFQCEVREASKWLDLFPVKGRLAGGGAQNRETQNRDSENPEKSKSLQPKIPDFGLSGFWGEPVWQCPPIELGWGTSVPPDLTLK